MARSAKRPAPNNKSGAHISRAAAAASMRAARWRMGAISRPASRLEGDVGDQPRPIKPDEAPLYVRYVDETSQAYMVRSLEDGAWMHVAKSRQATETFPVPPGARVPGAWLARWANWALVAAVAGGVGGILIGVFVAVMASLRLIRFRGRVRRWRQAENQPDSHRPLPAAATTERLRLRTAIWQGLLAAALGLFVFALLSGRVL